MAGRVDRHRPALNDVPRWLVPALAAPPVTLLAVFFAWPLTALIGRVDFDLDVLAAPGLDRVVWFTIRQAVLSTLLTLVIGFVPAYVLARHHFRTRSVVLAVVTVPFMLPTVVVGAAFLALLPSSWHGTGRAVIVSHVFFNLAVVVRLVGAMWAVLPTDLTAAARTLGASHGQVLRHIVFPLVRPGLWAAATVVFLFTFTAFGTVKVLGGPGTSTIEAEVVRRATTLGDVDGAAVLAVLQLLTLAAVVWLSNRLQRRATVALTAGVSTHPRFADDRNRRRRRLVSITAAIVAMAMAAPVVALVAQSFRLGGRWSLTAWRTLGDVSVRPGIGLGVDPLASLSVSLRFALVATLIAVVTGTLAALAITTSRRHGRLLDLGTMLPLGTSAVTVGLGMIITFDTAPYDWRGRWWLVPVGHSLVALPFVVRSLLPVLRAVPADQRFAAATLGASPLRAWWAIDVRRVLRAAARSGGLAAAISLGEFGATTFLTRAGRETLPIAISRMLGRAGDIPRAQGFALASILLAVTATVLVVADAHR